MLTHPRLASQSNRGNRGNNRCLPSNRSLGLGQFLSLPVLLPQNLRTSLFLRLLSVVLVVVVYIMLSIPVSAFAASNTTIAGLTNAGQQLAGQNVTFKGEVVGDIVNASKDSKWLLLQEGTASISVLVSSADAERITHLGRYNQTGTLIEVRGRFETDCTAHDGLTDVHAETIRILDEGGVRESSFNLRELQIGALLVLIGGFLIILHWRLRERTR